VNGLTSTLIALVQEVDDPWEVSDDETGEEDGTYERATLDAFLVVRERLTIRDKDTGALVAVIFSFLPLSGDFLVTVIGVSARPRS
jgi:hypothetical protein